MDEIKPCPFCNAHIDVVDGIAHHPFSSDVDCVLNDVNWVADHFRAAWNTRPPATMPDAEIVEMLAEAITDTLDMDWQPLWGATACLTALRNAGLIGDGR